MNDDGARAAALSPLVFLGVELPRRKVIVLGVMLGLFLSAVEATVVGTALPSIVASLRGLELYGGVVTAYLVASTVSVPAWGRLSDLHGRRPFYLLGVAIFLLGSILSGAVPEPSIDAATGDVRSTMPLLIAARALQGLGAGAIMPVGFTMVGDIFDLEERARVQGFLSSVWGLSSVVGPLVGAWIVKHTSWRWCFYLNVPFGLLAALFVGVAWSETREKGHERLRVLPLLLLTGSLGLALVAIGLAQKREATVLAGPAVAGAALVLALVMGAGFVLIERKARTPVFDLGLFRNPMFRAVAIGGPFSGMSMFAAITFTTLFVQGVLGKEPDQAGYTLAFLFFVWMALNFVSPRLALRFGFRPVAVLGAIAVVLGYALLAGAGRETAYSTVAASMVVVGVGMGLTIAPLVIGVQSSVERDRRGAATSLTQFSRSLGGTLGVAVISTVLATGLASEVARLGGERGLSPERARALSRDVDAVVREAAALPEVERGVLRDALASSMRAAFATALGASVIFLLSTFMIPRELPSPGATKPA
ncbi:MFS transporter [bacterium]|nr:MFS transporter [bacterium]